MNLRLRISMSMAMVMVLSSCLLISMSVHAKTTLRYIAPYELESAHELRKEIIRAFEEAHPDIEVEIIRAEDPHEKFIVMVAAGDAPDVVWTQNPIVYSPQGMLLSLERYLGKDEVDLGGYFPSALDLATFDGITYALPTVLNPIVMFYNADIWAEAGLLNPYEAAAANNWDLDAFRANSKKVAQPHKDLYAFWGGLWGWPNMAWPWIQAFGGDFLSADLTQVTIGDPEAVSALEWMWEIRNEDGVAVPPEVSLSGEALQSGQVAMITYGSFDLMPVYGQHITSFEWGVAPFPTGRDGRLHTLLAVQYHMIASESKAPDAAWEFIKWMAWGDGLEKYAELGGGLPANLQLANSSAFLDNPYLDRDSMMVFTNSAAVGRQMPIERSTEFNLIFPKLYEIMTPGFNGEEPAASVALRMKEYIEANLDTIIR